MAACLAFEIADEDSRVIMQMKGVTSIDDLHRLMKVIIFRFITEAV